MGWSTQRQGCVSLRCKAPPALPSFPHSSSALSLAHPREGERRTVSNGTPNAHWGATCVAPHIQRDLLSPRPPPPVVGSWLEARAAGAALHTARRARERVLVLFQ